MMMKILLFTLSVLSASASPLLSSDDLGHLFVKYAITQIKSYELKWIKDILRIHDYVWKSQSDIHRDIQCFICRSAFLAIFVTFEYKLLPDKVLKDVVIDLCTLAMNTPKVCRGYVELNFPILKYIIETTPNAHPRTFCGLLLQSAVNPNSCTFTDDRFEWSINLPPKPTNVNYEYGKVSSDIHLTVALISDSHIDPWYKMNGVADCDEPTCCRIGQKPKPYYFNSRIGDIINEAVVKIDDEVMIDVGKIAHIRYVIENRMAIEENPTPAGFWGDYRNCDTPTWAFEDVVKRIASHKDVDVVYYTGDNIDHHTWETTYELNNHVNAFFVKKLKKILEYDIMVIPTIGNHEAQPVNQFAPNSIRGRLLNTTWLYDSLATKWSVFLSYQATASFRQRGEFSELIRPGLRVISINNNVAYRLNWWLVYDPLNAKRHLEWLVSELYKAEWAGEKVHIISHIPPGDEDLMYTWTREYHRIVERFSSTITAQFTGHTHTDEFKVFYNQNNEAFNVAWGVGSTTAYQNVNPNYKIATFNKDYEPLNIMNYIYNLTEANLSPYKRPRWFMLYDMISTYQLQNLSPASIDNLLLNMVTNKQFLMDLYIAYSSKLSDVRAHCDDTCKFETLCRAATTVLWDQTHCRNID